MAVPIQTSWQLQTAEGEPTAVVRVRNLQSVIQGPQDAWGRPGRPQPALVSAEVSLAQPFGSSSSADVVAPDTVHYGLLSKAIMATLGRLEVQATAGQVASLHGVLSSIWVDLTGVDTLGTPANVAEKGSFLNLSYVRRLTVSVVLTKASLLGSGVSLSASAVFQESSMQARGLTLSLQGLRVPTLIGVNENERLAKQIVVANIGIEKYSDSKDDYASLEVAVVGTMTKSSFETLEALATDLASHITTHLRSTAGDSQGTPTWQLQIGLEKPTAVPFADAACVELRTSTDDVTEFS
ncbi:hypothetical protein AK830_g11320 [Neonectria ditissima]|uniref:Dihydroneopterin aldolase/epimerase domain-containing protein n=1 Tax=Neonectria ditissima TaxID=78410 RepID=A0A0P7B3R1_9HYPO|nr:hypothetical protein AK830_g11320 [Neonectria ditissima]